ncbi:hypothetical protein DGMP_03280 [Desulfomarina profundi]|uniref:ABC3 transporter permease C-terminal domain-containing protein n=1 Tax=Desulfomarina profundi TaxID=2772557 RepID=A0A8D5FFL9_9BACT|nr:FtsX-like permease family protein [Desulfomarina profundi]BCL59635.1 hypothetical protein DGMP_03280 [Desulfomarina profundi]
MRRLVELPLRKSIQMAYQSIRVRFFRSMVTTMSLVLAVAFLAFIQVGNNIAQGALSSGDAELVHVLTRIGFDISPGESAVTGSAKQKWILFLSLLVCVVGIVNAQLMSVTERFREIGTLKCLGALDHFIVRIFLLEAAIMGISGSVLGSFLGALSALVTSLARFGYSFFPFIPWGAIGITMAITVCTGTFLSLLGVLYPAIIAARMRPVEAMRVEQ